MVLNIKMLPVLLLLVLIVCEFAQCGVLETSNSDGRKKSLIKDLVFGGSGATILEFPHHLGLLEKERYFCGGSLISSLFAISAAHCFQFGPYKPIINLLGGTASQTTGGQIVGVEYYLIHPNFDKFMFDYDVAILKAEKSFDYPLISPASLPEPCLTECCDTCPETIVRVAGWGLTESSFYSDDLLQIKQSIMATSPVCDKAWEDVTSRMFCVTVENGSDTCHGDSGGGVIQGTNLLIGIISFGSDSCGKGEPAVYTNLENVEIREWIQNNTGL